MQKRTIKMTEVTFYIINTITIILAIALVVGIFKTYKYIKEIHAAMKNDSKKE